MAFRCPSRGFFISLVCAAPSAVHTVTGMTNRSDLATILRSMTPPQKWSWIAGSRRIIHLPLREGAKREPDRAKLKKS